MLSIQDMDPLEPVFESLDWALQPSSRVVIVMTHPAFRQPRHSGWGFDEGRKLTYRRVDAYLTPMAVPMKSVGGSAPTRSFHRPLSDYVNGLAAFGFAVDALREPGDLPEGERPGKRPARGNADAEIPLFLALRARRGVATAAGTLLRAGVAEQADAADLKSAARKGIRVQISAPAPIHLMNDAPERAVDDRCVIRGGVR